jgi:hypothetical protein
MSEAILILPMLMWLIGLGVIIYLIALARRLVLAVEKISDKLEKLTPMNKDNT